MIALCEVNIKLDTKQHLSLLPWTEIEQSSTRKLV